MNDIQSHRDFFPLTAGQIRELTAALRDVFGSNISREQFNDRLLMFLEDVPGYESGEASSALIESAWAAYGGAGE
ncbi:hypothetical protein PQQ99_21505 [Paraburkholderia sediminicola]|uniref:Uncharacterized protein n=1 Tax=Paraburkholderia metrosideri TaxID=580937 RepID=A0ABW9E4L8_9BURK